MWNGILCLWNTCMKYLSGNYTLLLTYILSRFPWTSRQACLNAESIVGSLTLSTQQGE